MGRGLLVLLACAACTPADDRNWSHSGQTDSFALRWTSAPSPVPLAADFAWTLRVEDLDGRGVEGADVELAVEMPEHGHGMSVAPVLTEDGADYTFAPLRFSMPGWWRLDVVVDAGDGAEELLFDIDCCE